MRALFVVTYRDDELMPAHPLRLALGDLATAPTVHRISLPALSEAAVRILAVESGGDAAALYRLTGGNAFFVTEILGTGGERVPVSVGDAVLARAARLSAEARAVLDVAAVIGSTIDPDLLLVVAGPVPDEVDEGIGRGLLRASDDGLASRHELTCEAILATIAPLRRRLLHARMLAVLRDAPRRRATWRSWRTTEKAPAIGRRCSHSPSPLPSKPSRSMPTGRRLLSTAGRSGLATDWTTPSEPACSVRAPSRVI